MPTPLHGKTVPKVAAITVADGNLQVTVTHDTVAISQVGPRGGQSGVSRFSPADAVRLRGLLELAETHRRMLEQAAMPTTTDDLHVGLGGVGARPGEGVGAGRRDR